MSIVHTTEAIQSLLRRGLTPITDNREALLELGFERAYPQVSRGYEAALWERSIELGRSSRDGRRARARERAVLERDAPAGLARAGDPPDGEIPRGRRLPT